MTESAFNKVADWKLATLLKKDSNTGVACEYCEKIFKNSFFYRTPLETASEKIVVLII